MTVESTTPTMPTGSPEGAPAPEGENPSSMEAGIEQPEGEGVQGGTEQKPDQDLELVQKFNSLAAQEKKFREDKEGFDTEKQDLLSFKEQLEEAKANPLKALKLLGHDFKDLAEQFLNDEKPTAEQQIKTLEERILADKKEREEEKQREREEFEASEREEIEREAAETIETAKKNIRDHIDSADDDRYDLIKHHDAYDTVLEVIQEVYNETCEPDDQGNPTKEGTILSFEDAALKVEEFLLDESEKYMGSSKMQKKYSKVEPKDDSPDSDVGYNHYERKMMEERYGNTLSSRMTSDGASAPDDRPKPYMSDDESKYYLGKKLAKMLEANS